MEAEEENETCTAATDIQEDDACSETKLLKDVEMIEDGAIVMGTK